jgi:hypothetical protein
MTQWDYLATLLFSTKLSPTRELYFGPVAGYAVVSTHGTPCFGCPLYKDPGAPVVGAYFGVWDRWAEKVDVGYGLEYRATGSINNKTTDPFENFHNGVNHTVMATVGFTFDASDVMRAAQNSGFAKSSYLLSDPNKLFSDIRLKQNVHLLATLENGLKIYSFKYLWDDATYVGVMAQDLLANPAWRDAVVTLPNGFYAVDYAMLGLRMATLEAWQAQGVAAIRSGGHLSVTKQQALQQAL